MPDPTHLTEAASSLESAAARAGDPDAVERLEDLSEQLHGFVESGRTPDHGRLARVLNALDEADEVADDDASDAIGRAREEVITFREGVEGV